MEARISTKLAAERAGIKPENVATMMRRHGYKKGADGKWSSAEVDQARIAGKMMDKSALEQRIADGQQPTLTQIKLRSQIDKLSLEIDMLKIERDKALGKLADVDEVVSRVTRLFGEMAMAVTTWRESAIAKTPELRKDIDRITTALQTALAEKIELAM